jgi:hypothetical protein
VDIVKLLLAFAAVVILINFKRPLNQSMLVGAILLVILFRIPLPDAASMTVTALTSGSTWSVIASFVLITFLQRILEERKLLRSAEASLTRLCPDRRIVAMLAPSIIGFLPSPGTATVCGAIVKSTVGDDLTTEEALFVTSYYRHIPESFFPTYTPIILGLELTGVATGSFILCMAPAVCLLVLMGYLFYLRKLSPVKAGEHPPEHAQLGKELRNLLYCLWSILSSIIFIVAFNLPVYFVLPAVNVLAVLIYRIPLRELPKMILRSFEARLILNTFVIMLFRELLLYTGVIAQLPDLFARLPLPTWLIFALVVFLGTILAGSGTMVALVYPAAYAAIPDGGAALLMLLTASGYMAMQMSPTHICLPIAVEYFERTLGDLIRKTLPVAAVFMVSVCGYYCLLRLIF